jgi:hypothetical protein
MTQPYPIAYLFAVIWEGGENMSQGEVTSFSTYMQRSWHAYDVIWRICHLVKTKQLLETEKTKQKQTNKKKIPKYNEV